MLTAVADSFLRSCVHLICHSHARARRDQSAVRATRLSRLGSAAAVDRFWFGAAMVMVGGRRRELSEYGALDNDRQIRSTDTENAFPLTHLARDVPSKRVIVMRNRSAYDFPFGSLGTKFVTDRSAHRSLSSARTAQQDGLLRMPVAQSSTLATSFGSRSAAPAAGSGRSDHGARWVGAPLARV